MKRTFEKKYCDCCKKEVRDFYNKGTYIDFVGIDTQSGVTIHVDQYDSYALAKHELCLDCTIHTLKRALKHLEKIQERNDYDGQTQNT